MTVSNSKIRANAKKIQTRNGGLRAESSCMRTSVNPPFLIMLVCDMASNGVMPRRSVLRWFHHCVVFCSGHGLSGMALLFWLSIVAVPAMFAGGIGTAFAMDAAGALDSYVCYDSSPC